MVDVTPEDLAQQMEFGLVRGRSKYELHAKLTHAGWPSDLVREYLKKIQKELGPASLFQINTISKSYGQNKILDQISLRVLAGEIFGIMGASGSGKTTFLNILVGFLQPDTGSVTILTEDQQAYDVFRHPEYGKTLIGFSTQNSSFYDKLTVRENLEHFAALYNISSRELRARVSTLIKSVNLLQQQDQFASELSGGQKKRLDIACALIHKPRILILDEPTADLDPLAAQDLFALIKSINETGTTIIIASHIFSELDANCDRIGVLRDGRMTECGSPDELKRIFSRYYELKLETESGQYGTILSQMEDYPSLFQHMTKGKELVIRVPAPKKAFKILGQILTKNPEVIKSLSLARPTLYEVFDFLMKK